MLLKLEQIADINKSRSIESCVEAFSATLPQAHPSAGQSWTERLRLAHSVSVGRCFENGHLGSPLPSDHQRGYFTTITYFHIEYDSLSTIEMDSDGTFQ